ncbi:MAG: hypothetical protein QW184_00785 [Nanopusillaceae archaeon]
MEKLATFKIEKELWQKFLEKCREKNRSASEILRKFILAFINSDIEFEEEIRIKTK